MKRIIATDKAPQAIGPYSQAVEAGDFLYVSGQVPVNPKSGQLTEPDIQVQTRQALENIKAILEAAGYSLAQVVKTTCLLIDIQSFKAMNEVYARYFPENPPARAAFAVKDLPMGALVEIEAIAFKGGKGKR